MERECVAAAIDQQVVRVNYLLPRQSKLQTLYLNAMDFHLTPIFPIAPLPLPLRRSTSFLSVAPVAVPATRPGSLPPCRTFVVSVIRDFGRRSLSSQPVVFTTGNLHLFCYVRLVVAPALSEIRFTSATTSPLYETYVSAMSFPRNSLSLQLVLSATSDFVASVVTSAMGSLDRLCYVKR